jgi:hypothetical protein
VSILLIALRPGIEAGWSQVFTLWIQGPRRFLPLADGMWLQTGWSILANKEQTLEAWAAISRHLQDASRASNEEKVTDTRLQRFTTAMKTPGGAGSF